MESSLRARRGLSKTLNLPNLPAVPPPERGDALGAAALRGFQMLEVLGQGTASVVRRALGPCGQEVALKIVRTDDEEMLETARKEYDLLVTIKHPHIVRALDFLVGVGRIALVLELFQGIELDVAAQRQPLHRYPEACARPLFSQLLDAVDYLHRQRVLHRDVKGANILVSQDSRAIKLVDFNTACRLSDGAALTMTGTCEYAAPEVLLGNSHSDLSDIWSAGLCLHLMLSGRLPQRRDQHGSFVEFAKAVSSQAASLEGRLCWREASEDCKAVLRRCLSIEITHRPAAMTLLQERWFERPRAPRPCALEDTGSESSEEGALGEWRRRESRPQRKRRACSLP